MIYYMIMKYIHDPFWSQHWLWKLWFLCLVPSWELSHILYQPALLKMMIFLFPFDQCSVPGRYTLEKLTWNLKITCWKRKLIWTKPSFVASNCGFSMKLHNCNSKKKQDTIPILKKSLKNLKHGFTTPIDNSPKSQVPFQLIVPIPIRIPLSCDSFVTGIFLSSRSWHWLFHNLEVLSWQLWFQPFRPLTLYKKHLLRTLEN